jgi:hypothetical protein
LTYGRPNLKRPKQKDVLDTATLTPPPVRTVIANEKLLNWRTKLNDTWRSLNNRLSSLSEEEVLTLLSEEREGARRVSMLERLHQRYNTLRVARERLELLKGAIQP